MPNNRAAGASPSHFLKMVKIPHLTCKMPIFALSLPAKNNEITIYHETQQANLALRVMQGV